MDNTKLNRKCYFKWSVITGLCILLLIFIFWGIPSYYKWHITDDTGQPISRVLFNFQYQVNLNDAIMGQSGTGEIKKTFLNDENGDASYFGFVKYQPCLTNIHAEGYYENRYSEANRKGIILREKINPVPMYLTGVSRRESISPGGVRQLKTNSTAPCFFLG